MPYCAGTDIEIGADRHEVLRHDEMRAAQHIADGVRQRGDVDRGVWLRAPLLCCARGCDLCTGWPARRAFHDGALNLATRSSGIGFDLIFEASLRVASDPDAGLEAFKTELAVLEQLVLHLEARSADSGEGRVDRDLVAEAARDHEAPAGIDHRVPDEIVRRPASSRTCSGRSPSRSGDASNDRTSRNSADRRRSRPGRNRPIRSAMSRMFLCMNYRGAMRSAPSMRITSPLI